MPDNHTLIQPLSEIILPCYYPLHQPDFRPSRIYLRGGRYSGKSVEVARYIILALAHDKSKSAIAFRRFRQHITRVSLQ